MYIDLDMIICGCIDDLILNYQGKFSTLSTNDIFCEKTQDGYNSSIMVFGVHQYEIKSWEKSLNDEETE